jgi:DNA-binding IscR family transcriptional regulator
MLHMAREDGPISSERLGEMLGTNAAVVRRTMAGLRRAGYVQTERGSQGGWMIACDLAEVTLLDVYQAVGETTLFAIGNDRDHPDCAVEQVVNAAIADALREAETLLLNRLGAITLSELSREFDALIKTRRTVHTAHPRS